MRSARWNTFNFIALSIKILLFRIVSVTKPLSRLKKPGRLQALQHR